MDIRAEPRSGSRSRCPPALGGGVKPYTNEGVQHVLHTSGIFSRNGSRGADGDALRKARPASSCACMRCSSPDRRDPAADPTSSRDDPVQALGRIVLPTTGETKANVSRAVREQQARCRRLHRSHQVPDTRPRPTPENLGLLRAISVLPARLAPPHPTIEFRAPPPWPSPASGGGRAASLGPRAAAEFRSEKMG